MPFRTSLPPKPIGGAISNGGHGPSGLGFHSSGPQPTRIVVKPGNGETHIPGGGSGGHVIVVPHPEGVHEIVLPHGHSGAIVRSQALGGQEGLGANRPVSTSRTTSTGPGGPAGGYPAHNADLAQALKSISANKPRGRRSRRLPGVVYF